MRRSSYNSVININGDAFKHCRLETKIIEQQISQIGRLLLSIIYLRNIFYLIYIFDYKLQEIQKYQRQFSHKLKYCPSASPPKPKIKYKFQLLFDGNHLKSTCTCAPAPQTQVQNNQSHKVFLIESPLRICQSHSASSPKTHRTSSVKKFRIRSGLVYNFVGTFAEFANYIAGISVSFRQSKGFPHNAPSVCGMHGI